jgi:HD superfamily phosphodiesterase
MNINLEGIRIPDSKLAREIMELVRDTEPPLLFRHSSRVYYWGALAGKRRGLRFDAELLYAGAMFHDMGLTHQHSTAHERFEVDSANTARDFLRNHGIAQQDIDTVWTAIRAAYDAGHSATHAPGGGAGDGRRRNGCAGPGLCRI